METGIIRGLRCDGSRVYYTGRGGSRFISSDFADAFTGYNVEGARVAALRLNKGTELHGIRFVAMPYDKARAEANERPQ